MEIRSLPTVAFFVLVIYAFSGGVVQNFVNYPSWRLIGADEFPRLHKFVVRRQFIYVPFVFLGLLANIVAIWFHHPGMSTPLIALSAALYLFIVVVTVTLVIPLHMTLDQIKSDELIDRIVKYRPWIQCQD